MTNDTSVQRGQLKQVVESNQGDTFLIHAGIAITDPFFEETGRFEVNPIEHYGMAAILSVIAEYRGEFVPLSADRVRE